MLPAATALLLIWPAPAIEAERPAPDGWRVLAGLPADRRVQLMDQDGVVHAGRLLTWSDEALTLAVNGADVSFPKEQVTIVRALAPLGGFQTVYGPWSNLGRLVDGQKVSVHRAGGLPLNGRFAGYSEEGVTVDTGKRKVFAPREKIGKIALWIGNKAEQGGELGGAIGFFGGLALTIAASTQGGSDSGCGAVEATSQGGYALGAAIGSLFPAWQTIYKAPRP
jgi:hypothetical protein